MQDFAGTRPPNPDGESPEGQGQGMGAPWAAAEAVTAPLPQPAVERLLVALRAGNLNGGALFARFTLGGPTAELFHMSERTPERRSFERLLTLPGVRSAPPELRLGSALDTDPEFEAWSCPKLERDIANTLLAPAYHTTVVTPEEASVLSADFRRAFVGEDCAGVRVFRSREPWCAWFLDAGFDRSWLALDERVRVMSLLCSTDSD
ncbi:MAG: hypothetical protein HOQ19_00320 [Gemmatimonadaceae bacterium]|nr:hypothetical protein [Gemmatimonadaceae bacterium]